MKRREILRYTAILSGAAVIGPVALSISSCSPDTMVKASNFKPSFFNEAEFDMITTLVDVILPETDSPSASSVGVDQMIDHMVGKVFIKEDQSAYKSKFDKLFAYVDQKTELKGISSSSEEDQIKLVGDLQSSEDEDVNSAFKAIKQQSIAYYLTSEEIGTKFLNYLPLPGEYEGCITLASVGGKAWAE